MAKKVVLISYLQSNKKYVITEQHPERHVAFLREQFLVNLKKTNATASATVTLQRFDPVFDCLVDLEDDDEVHDKDRLTAVVSTVSSEETKVRLIIIDNNNSGEIKCYYIMQICEVGHFVQRARGIEPPSI